MTEGVWYSLGSDITWQRPTHGRSRQLLWTNWLRDEGNACFGAICQMFLRLATEFYCDYLEGLQGLQPCCSAAQSWCWCLAPLPIIPHVPLFRDVFRGFPALLVMCAAGDGGLAMLILLSGSGKYPSSLCRRKTTKSRVWLQPAGFSAPTRTRPRVTVWCFLLSIYPCMTLFSYQTPIFNLRKIKHCNIV